MKRAGKAAVALALFLALPYAAQAESQCGKLPSYNKLSKALVKAVEPKDPDANGGLGNHMWAVMVDRGGIVCEVTYSGDKVGDQWPGSRAIAAEKAFTANGFSLPKFALSTANLFWASQPYKSLYGVVEGNPVDPDVIYRGSAKTWGKKDDPMVGQRAGGTIVFAGGLPLYNADGKLLGALGLSGDQSCTDHVIAWKVRHALNLDNVPAGVTKANNDNIIYDIHHDPSKDGMASTSGYGHPTCSPAATEIAQGFDKTHPTGPEE